MMIQRIQQHLNAVFDAEFKLYLKNNDIIVDPDKFSVKLPTPQNFAAYRKQTLDADLLNNYQTAEGIGHLSPRFALMEYLMLSQQQIIDNERMLKEELGIDPDDERFPSQFLYHDEVREALVKRLVKRIEAEFSIEDDADVDMSDTDDFGEDDFGDDFGGGGGGGSSFGSPPDLGGDLGGDMGGDLDLGGDDLGGDLAGDAGGDLDMGGPDEPTPEKPPL